MIDSIRPSADPARDRILDAHVVATFDAVDPDGGSEYGIGWNWMLQIAGHVRRLSAVVTEEAFLKLKGDGRLPDNVDLFYPGQLHPVRTVLPLPSYYLGYIETHRAFSGIVADTTADIAHQVTLGTPYWGSAIAGSSARRLLGPVGISSPTPPALARHLGLRDWARESVRTTLLRTPFEPVSATPAIKAADHVLTVDSRSAALAERHGRPATAMLQDGATPVPAELVIGRAGRRNLVWAGRMMPRKGAFIAVEAFARARRSLPEDIDLIMIGDGAEHQSVARAVDAHRLQDRVELWGSVPHADTLTAIAGAEALVFTSLRDTFGGVVLEAAERATPTVVALHGGVDGLRTWWPRSAGWSGSVRSLGGMIDTVAQGMVAATTSEDADWNQRSAAAFEFARAHDWDARGATLATIYRALLTGNGPQTTDGT